MAATNRPGLRILTWIVLLWPAAAVAQGTRASGFRLPNGLRVLVSERRTAPLLAMELWVRAGAREEAAGETGAAHFLEHTLFKGTVTRGVGEADTAIENLGATLNAATGPDYARFYTSVGTEHASLALAVLADVVRNATLPAPEVERERQVIRDELAQRDSQPSAALVDRLYGTAFRGRPYANPPGGTARAIGTLSRDSLSAFYRRTYVPARCTLVLAGDVTAEQARAMAEQAFGDWRPAGSGDEAEAGRDPGRAGSPAPNDAGAALPTAEPVRQVESADIGTAIIGVAYRAPAAADGQAARAGEIVATLLGQSNLGGRLAVPELAGCGARVSFAARRDSSLFIVSAAPPPGPAGRPRTPAELAASLVLEEQAILGAVAALSTTPPGPAEIAAAKSALLGRSIFQTETASGLAAAMGGAAVTEGRSPEAWRDELASVTVADVRRFIATWLVPGGRTTVLLVPTREMPAARP